MRYQARMIVHGAVVKQLAFEADTPLEAWAIANDGIDPLSGTWVESVPAPQAPQRVDPAKLAPKAGNTPESGALRESVPPEQGNAPQHSRTAAGFFGELPNPAGYMPGLGEPERDNEIDSLQALNSGL